jgi:hypothetical protein
MRISLLLVCTGKYDIFLPELLEQVDRLFFPNDKVEVFLFTDKIKQYISSKRVSVNYIYTEHKPFPASTLYRYKYFNNMTNVIRDKSDYVFYMDVDMRIVEPIGHEILSDGLIATKHCGFIHGGWGSTRVDQLSRAFVPKEKWGTYYAGGFQGGEVNAYMDAVNVLANNIDEDERNGIIAEYHDESHWNHYLIHNQHSELSHEYCMGEAYLSGTPKIIALDKNHSEIRS